DVPGQALDRGRYYHSSPFPSRCFRTTSRASSLAARLPASIAFSVMLASPEPIMQTHGKGGHFKALAKAPDASSLDAYTHLIKEKAVAARRRFSEQTLRRTFVEEP